MANLAKDSCNYEGKIVIFGDFDPKINQSDFFFATSDDEVDEVIKYAELQQNTFLRIDDLCLEDRITKIDVIISSTIPQVVEDVTNYQAGSFKGCFIV